MCANESSFGLNELAVALALAIAIASLKELVVRGRQVAFLLTLLDLGPRKLSGLDLAVLGRIYTCR